jgi:hypothetical protein
LRHVTVGCGGYTRNYLPPLFQVGRPAQRAELYDLELESTFGSWDGAFGDGAMLAVAMLHRMHHHAPFGLLGPCRQRSSSRLR